MKFFLPEDVSISTKLKWMVIRDQVSNGCVTHGMFHKMLAAVNRPYLCVHLLMCFSLGSQSPLYNGIPTAQGRFSSLGLGLVGILSLEIHFATTLEHSILSSSKGQAAEFGNTKQILILLGHTGCSFEESWSIVLSYLGPFPQPILSPLK